MTGARATSHDVAIVGMACVFPGAGDLDAYWRNIVNGVDAIAELPEDFWPGFPTTRLRVRRGGLVPAPYRFDAVGHRVMPIVAREGEPEQFVLLDLVSRALADAGIEADDDRLRRTDLIVGSGGHAGKTVIETYFHGEGFARAVEYLRGKLPGLGEAEARGIIEELRETVAPDDPEVVASCIPNLVASRTCNRLGLGGAAFTVDAACASSLIAVEQACRRLRSGLCDVAVAGGVGFTQNPSWYHVFDRINALSASGACRPFDARADGLIIGEGAGAIALMPAAVAAREGRRCYALIKGVGIASDGRTTGILAPSSAGQQRALRRAYDDAGVDPASVGFVEAHGTGTPTGDPEEIATLAAVYGPRRFDVPLRALGSVKSMIGHTMPAAGVASLIKATLALTNQVLPPSLHCEEPRVELEGCDFYVNSTARPWIHGPAAPRRAGVNAFGFGGINAHVVLEEVPRPAAAAARVERESASAALPTRSPTLGVDWPAELLLISAADRAEMGRRLSALAAEIEAAPPPWPILARRLAETAEFALPCKLALLVAGRARPAEVADRLRGIAAALAEAGQGADGDDVCFGEDAAAAPGKLAVAFTGMAPPGFTAERGEYLIDLALHVPSVRDALGAIERRDRHPEDPIPTSLLLQPPPGLSAEIAARLRGRLALLQATGKRADLAQHERNLSGCAVLATSWCAWRLVETLDIDVDMVCGFSLGDVAAVCASGMADFYEGQEYFWADFRRNLEFEASYQTAGCMAAVTATEEQLAELIEGRPTLSIAIHASRRLQVVAGSHEDIEYLVHQLFKRRIAVTKLPFPPIHTPMQRPLVEQMSRDVAEQITLGRPHRVAYSGVTAEPMPTDPQAVRDVLEGIATQGVRFWQTLHRMYADGARVFLQVGPGKLVFNGPSVLEADDAHWIAVDGDQDDAVTRTLRLCARLFALGVRFRPEALFAGRGLHEPAESPQPAEQGVALSFWTSPFHVAGAEPLRSPAGADGPAAGVAGGYAFVRDVLSHDPGQALQARVRLDLDEHGFLRDHVFVKAIDVKPVRECLAVVPMTLSMELAAEAASLLVPDKPLIGMQEFRALRWITFEDSDRLELQLGARVTRRGSGAIAVAVEIVRDGQTSATGTMLFADRYRHDVELSFTALAGARPFEIDARELYEQGFLFHGPDFRAVTALGERGRQGLTAELQVEGPASYAPALRGDMLIDPVLLDGAAQALGALTVGTDVCWLPTGVGQVALYGSSPRPGTKLPLRLEIRAVDPGKRHMTADIEIQDGRGGVWCRLIGWQSRVFHWTQRLRRNLWQPRRFPLARVIEIPGLDDAAVVAAWERDERGDVPFETLFRTYLSSAEWRRMLEAEMPWPRRIEHIGGRIAAKDAARLWLARRGGREPMLHPAEIEVDSDNGGPPRLACTAVQALPSIGIAHADGRAVAIAAPWPVGIDIEPEDAGRSLDPGLFADDEERRWAQEHADRRGLADWRTLLWCAKEAAAKLEGSGLQGRPRDFRVVGIDGDRLCVRCIRDNQDAEVRCVSTEGSLIAVATWAGAGPTA
jgi:acyl transferase domain-containing protein/phosphopantetheinyl transferase